MSRLGARQPVLRTVLAKLASAVTRPYAVLALFAAPTLGGVLFGCATDPPPTALEPFSERAGTQPEPGEPNRAFAREIASPQPGELPADSDARVLLTACGESDAPLTRVASSFAQLDAGADAVDIDALGYQLRAAGAPYVWPRAWRFDGSDAELGEAKERMQRWLAGFGDGGTRRCGVALLRKPGRHITVFAIAVDTLADLQAVPTRVRVGQWVDVNATLRVAADAAKLVVLGPRGAPHAVPTTLDGTQLRARFNADHEGAWLVQVLAAVDGGPRPLLEALVFAGVEPPAELVMKAPGEELADSAKDPRAALYAMVNAARASEGVTPLVRDSGLEALAQAHADAMHRARKTAHDAGDGDLNQRLARAGLELRAGENVAHAASAALSHRALWASPSHRENLLLADFAVVGIGVAADADGTLWICELFAPPR